jgi:DNA-binding Lrp family transcriptional regulator
MDTSINGKVPESQSFFLGATDASEIDVAPLHGEDECNCLILERIGVINSTERRGAIVEEIAKYIHLSYTATAARVRELREEKLGKSRKAFISSSKKGNQYFLFSEVSLEAVQKIMQQRGISYNKYLVRRGIGEIYDESDNLQKLESIEDSSSEQKFEQKTEDFNNANHSVTIETSDDINKINSFESSDNISDSLSNQVVLQKTVTLCLTQIVQIKQDNALLKEENIFLKEELTKLKIQISELDKKLQQSSDNQLLNTLDSLLTLNKIKNGKE